MKNEILNVFKKFEFDANDMFKDGQDYDKVIDEIMLVIGAKFHLVDKINNETGRELIIRLTELGFCKKDIERISRKTRQYVHKIIKGEYIKQGGKNN